MTSSREGETYISAGVDLDAASEAKKLIERHVVTTFTPQVLGKPGFFGGLFQLSGFEHPVLVSSTDGVGTKLKIAAALNKYDSIGVDIVNHCVNDILTGGARPLFFLDYIASGRLMPARVEEIVSGLAQACREVGCVLIGGETAEMPGMYAEGEYELVGFIVGAVERESIIDGSSLHQGDVLLGLPSVGLHTNGYALARKVLDIGPDPVRARVALSTFYPELGRTLGEELLQPHRCYYQQLWPVLSHVKGVAHITGGGLPGNVSRILPEGLAARFDSQSWVIPPIFQLIQRRGSIDREEMFKVFNMGIGMVLACSPEKVKVVCGKVPEAQPIGEVVKQRNGPKAIVT